MVGFSGGSCGRINMINGSDGWDGVVAEEDPVLLLGRSSKILEMTSCSLSYVA
jgi:hypothetical protein